MSQTAASGRHSILALVAQSIDVFDHGKSVAVIGAGAGGLVAARHLRDAGLAVRVFESSGQVGGIWVYGDHSAMYDSLRTNIPKEIMAFSDVPFDPSLPSFIKHTDVLSYLQAYADRFALRDSIAFNTTVHSAEYVAAGREGAAVEGGWRINGEERLYDALVVANGRYNKPRYPRLIKMGFRGPSTHSKYYREPSAYASQRVLVVGGSWSGSDLVWELSSVATTVVWSGTQFTDADTAADLVAKLPASVCLVGRIQGVEEDGRYISVGSDGQLVTSTDTIDAVIWATGYTYDFPFFAPGSGLIPSGTADDPQCLFDALHLHVFRKSHPASLFFVGLTFGTGGFFFCMEVQAKAIVAVLKGQVSHAELAALPRFPHHYTPACYCALLEMIAQGSHESFPHTHSRNGSSEIITADPDALQLPPHILLRKHLHMDTTLSRKRLPGRYRERNYHICMREGGEGEMMAWQVTEPVE
ncbi:unnamed protein product [Vitrella brassicaformis CCMP3155]|uniref:Flavin-containing monooxygenase n=1 Tax=Vitrella brassicaformis (strain CCMP3155) TaxID=1169540 RepID=A0A0G4EHT9_VITBC|nr:unnamed protein product [Vitrella brassicaformis CCMP3155]|eukprot:CEL95474.1 unnamed protein product [Vitrella brassicaformis CCMP3155]